MKRASVSFHSIFGVVPEETSAWKPEIAPQAMVTNRNGKQLALDDRSAAVNELRDRGKLNVGMNNEHAKNQQRDGAQLHVGGEIIARLKQEPDRQDGCDEAVSAIRIVI